MTSPVEVETQERSWKNWTIPEVVVVDGVETAYRRAGNGEPVLYLHGAIAPTRSWLPIHEAMAADVDLIAPEHPGFGDTVLPAEFDEWDDWLLHYDAFLRALKLEKVHLVGHSLGGMMAAKLAILYPDRFSSVTLVNPFGLRMLDEPLRNLWRWTPEEMDENYFNGRRSAVAEYFDQEGTPGDMVQAYAESTAAALLFWNPRYDIKLDHRLSRVSAPLLAIGVDDDRVMGNAMAEKFAELVPHGTYVKISGAPDAPSSHMVTLEQPSEVASVIVNHVRTNS